MLFFVSICFILFWFSLFLWTLFRHLLLFFLFNGIFFFSQAQAQQDHDFIKNTKGFMFFSTPHLGTNVARLNSPTKFLFFPSTEVCELEEDSPQLVDLNQNFVQLGTIHILRNHF